MTSITLDEISSFITTKGVDTLMVSKLLRQFNFSEDQAEVVSELIKQTDLAVEKRIAVIEEKIEFNSNKMTSREDLSIVEKNLELQIEKTRTELKLQIEKTLTEVEKVRTEISQSKSEIIKWVAGLMIANTGLLFTLIKFFN